MKETPSVGYDYIVIGGGSAGSVIASRLSERPEIKVLLIEAGVEDRSLFLRMPLAARLLRTRNLFDWGYGSEPEPFAAERAMAATRGKVLGGSSSVNGMIYSRGDPRDYDEWAQLGARGWSFEDVLPFFKRSERNWRGETDWHGGEGPVSVSPMLRNDPLTTAMEATARRLGHPICEDFEGGAPEGFGLPDLTTRRGARASASKAYLGPARRRSNLTILTSAHVSRILVEKGRAVGVEFVRDGAARKARAEREVVLSAGAYGSPQILMLSGIGPADHLRAIGTPVVHDSPGVGRGLQEHPAVAMGFRAKQVFQFSRKIRADRIAMAVALWRLTGAGLPGTQPICSVAFHKSRPELDRPDIESIFIPTSLDAHVWFPCIRKPREDMMTALSVALYPRSRGRVELASADPFAKPRITFNLLADAHDMDVLRHSIRWKRALLSERPIADFVGDELFPGKSVQSDSDIDAYIRGSAALTHHPAGTCRMGQDPDCVVDPSLRVLGVDGLRVADASVMPKLVGGHTNAPAMMIGEKAAMLLSG